MCTLHFQICCRLCRQWRARREENWSQGIGQFAQQWGGSTSRAEENEDCVQVSWRVGFLCPRHLLAPSPILPRHWSVIYLFFYVLLLPVFHLMFFFFIFRRGPLKGTLRRGHTCQNESTWEAASEAIWSQSPVSPWSRLHWKFPQLLPTKWNVGSPRLV